MGNVLIDRNDFIRLLRKAYTLGLNNKSRKDFKFFILKTMYGNVVHVKENTLKKILKRGQQ